MSLKTNGIEAAPTDALMDRKVIKAILLLNGFAESVHENGVVDLQPYVYSAVEAVLLYQKKQLLNPPSTTCPHTHAKWTMDFSSGTCQACGVHLYGNFPVRDLDRPG
jgi:hypothetical protein